MMKPRTVAWMLLAAGILFLVGAILPLRRGESVNVALLLLAGAFIVLAPIVAKRAGGSADSRPPAA
jgi:hypothetical protein